MNAVAIAGASSPRQSSTEMELVKAASRGDREAFGDLYHRHGQSGWRLAQAVALTPPDAAATLAEGFARALRAVRRRQVPASQPFRPVLLAGVYRSGIDRLHLPDQPAASDLSSRRGDSEAVQLAAAAFWSLPDRWRAALWLADVEGLDPGRIAPILVVSSAVAGQLVARGRSGLADRYRQAGQPAPTLIGDALRPLIVPLPAGLASATLEAWLAALKADPVRRFGPAAGWLSERASRPLSMAVGGVLALGLVALGVLGQRGDLASFGPTSLGGGPAPASTLGIRDASGVRNLAASGAGGSSLLLGPGGATAADLTSSEGTTVFAGSTGGAEGASGSTGAGSGSSTSGTSATTTSTATGPAGNGSSGSTASGSGSSSSGSGASGSSGSTTGSGSSETTTSSGTAATPATVGPVTITTNGLTVAVPGVLTVGAGTGGLTLGVGSSPTTTTPTTTVPAATSTAAPATTTTTTTCIVNLLGIKVCV